MAVEAVIREIQAIMRSVTGAVDAPELPPDKIATSGPFLVCYVQDGVWDGNTPEDIRGLHNIVIELHVPYQSLPRAVERTLPFHEAVPKALFTALRDRTLPSIDTFAQITYRFGALGWQSSDPPDTFGYRWTITGVKTRETL